MNQRQLTHFVELAETLNFREAASKLNIVQPALSMSIKRLEAEIGVQLIQRTTRSVQLTESGRAALVEFKKALSHLDRAKQRAIDAKAGFSGKLVIGFVGSASFDLLPRIVRRFRIEYPNVVLSLMESSGKRILALIENDEMDVGLIRLPSVQSDATLITPLELGEFVVVVPAKIDRTSANRAIQTSKHNAGIEQAAHCSTSIDEAKNQESVRAQSIAYGHKPSIGSAKSTLMTLPTMQSLADRIGESDDDSIFLHDLAKAPFINYSFQESPMLHMAVINACREAGFTPRIVQEAIQVQTLVALVESGLGVGLVPSVSVRHQPVGARFLKLKQPTPACETGLAIAYNPEKQTESCKRFVETAQAKDLRN